MKWSRLICLAALASQLVASGAAADRAAATPDGNSGTAKVPPVLRQSEPRDNWQVTLPGPGPPASPPPQGDPPSPPPPRPARPPPAPAPEKAPLPSPPPVAPAVRPAPQPAPAPAPAKPVQDAILPRPLPLLVPAAQVKPSPPSLQIGSEVAAYCQKQIGHWKENDARKLLGEPKRHRPTYDENKSVTGPFYPNTALPINTRSWNSIS